MSWTVNYYSPIKGGARRKLKSTEIKQMDKYAKLASASYSGQPIPKGFKVDSRSTDQMKILYNPKTKQIVYSIRGTENLSDLYDDAKIFLGRASNIKRTAKLQKLILDSNSDYKDYKPIIVAHSLGATVGKRISDKTNIDYIGFNRGSSPFQKLSDSIGRILNKPLTKKQQTDYTVKSDIISSPWLSNDDDIVEVPKSANSSHTMLNFGGSCKYWRL